MEKSLSSNEINKNLQVDLKIKEMKKILNNCQTEHGPLLNISNLINIFGISYLNAMYLMNQFILSLESDKEYLNNLIIFYQIIFKNDKGDTHIQIISSDNKNINNLDKLENKITSFSVIAVCNKKDKEEFEDENYRSLCDDIKLEYSSEVNKRFNEMENEQQKSTTNNNQILYDKPHETNKEKNNQNKEDNSQVNKNEIKNNQILDNNKPSGNSKIINDDEENYYMGFNPKNDEEESKHSKNSKHTESLKEVKSKNGKNKRKKESKIDETISEKSIEIKSNDNSQIDNKPEEPKKILKKRKVKKKIIEKDDEGYDVEKEIEEEEEYWEEEKSKPKSRTNVSNGGNFKNNQNNKAKNNKKGTKKVQSSKGQTSLDAFFN